MICIVKHKHVNLILSTVNRSRDMRDAKPPERYLPVKYLHSPERNTVIGTVSL